jgi:hypothetical protein
MQMNLPTSEELHQRLAHPLPLTNPLELLSKAEQLVQMDSWPEIVVGIGLLTGRGLVEVLHTGHFTEKSAYTVWFAGPMTVYEQMCDPFEVPTLGRADLVLAALHRLRQFFNHHFFGVERHNISRQCSEQVREAVYRHLLDLVPLRSGERNVYKQLSRGVYSRLATLFYCPCWVDEIIYMATIQNHRKILEAVSEEERLTLALAAGYQDYVILDTSGEMDKRRGIRLGEPEVEQLDIFRQHEEKKKHLLPEEGSNVLLREKPNQRVVIEREMDEGGRDEEGQSILGSQERREKPQERPQQKHPPDLMTASEHHSPLSENEERERVLDFVLQVEDEKQGQALTDTQWLERRWAILLGEIADFTTDDKGDEEEICSICEWEMEIWRRYCKKAKTMTFQEMVMATRIMLKVNLPAPQNEWWNPETEEWEHIGRKYFILQETEWEQMKGDWLARRLLLKDPELIVSRAKGLLYAGLAEASAWPALVVGIAVVTGQSLANILRDSEFAQKSSFSLVCQDTSVSYNPLYGQPFEVPTLVRADLVIEAWERVRALVDCAQKERKELLDEYWSVIAATAEKNFLDLVPLPAEQTSIFTMLTKSVYSCLAIAYYCPTEIDSIEFLAAICNAPLLLEEGSPTTRFACAAMLDFMEYRIADECKGLWLERPGVDILEIFRRGTKQEDAVVKVVLDEDDLASLDEIRREMGFDLVSALQKDAAPSVLASERGALTLLLTLKNEGVSSELYEFIRLGLEHLRGDFAEFLSVSLDQEVADGLKLQRPFETMLSSELHECPHPQAQYELSRRAMITVMRYNLSVSDPLKRWYLDENVIAQLIPQARQYYIEQYLQENQELIDQHHRQLKIVAQANRKPISATETLHLSEYPSFFKEQMRCLRLVPQVLAL